MNHPELNDVFVMFHTCEDMWQRSISHHDMQVTPSGLGELDISVLETAYRYFLQLNHIPSNFFRRIPSRGRRLGYECGKDMWDLSFCGKDNPFCIFRTLNG